MAANRFDAGLPAIRKPAIETTHNTKVSRLTRQFNLTHCMNKFLTFTTSVMYQFWKDYYGYRYCQMV